MRPSLRLRTLIGALPYAIDRLVDTAFGPWSAYVRRASPVVATLLAAGAAVAGLSLSHSAFSDFSGYLPWGVAFLAAVALALVLIGTRRRAEERPSVVPPLIGLLLVVSIIPAIQSGAELILTRSTASDFVDRITGTDVSLLDLQGLAMRLPLTAEANPSGQPVWFYPVRDDPSDSRIALVRSPLALAALDLRQITARVVVDGNRVAGGARALSSHGWLPASDRLVVGDRYLAEASDTSGDVRNLGSYADLGSIAPGSLVRVTLRFRGRGVATCEAFGSPCDAARLANGDGGFLQIADDPSGSSGPILVQTTYPGSDAPIHAVGRQVRAEAQLASLLALPWVNRLLGWGDVLSVAYLDQDPQLPVDRFWLGPLIFLGIVLLLLVGRRAGYPVFILEGSVSRPPRQPVPGFAPRVVPAAISGRLARPRGGPMDVEEAPGELRSPASANEGVVLLVRAPGETLELQLPAGRGSLNSLDRGEVQWLSGRQPALWIHWFGSDARLVFADRAAMASAEAILEAFA